MPRKSSLTLSLTTCPAGRPRILVAMGLDAPFFMPSNAKVELDAMLWYPNVACIHDNAGVREDEAGLYWTTQRAAEMALAAAQTRLPPAIWVWVRSGIAETTLPAEVETTAREVLGAEHVIRAASVPIPPALGELGFVAKLRIEGITAEDAAQRLDAVELSLWDEEPRADPASPHGMSPDPVLGW